MAPRTNGDVADFGGEVPADVDELQKLPGVGRKTANCVSVRSLRAIPGGHRRGHPRLPHRPPAEAGRPSADTPQKVEDILLKVYPREQQWPFINHQWAHFWPRVPPRPQPPLRRPHRRRSVPHPRPVGVVDPSRFHSG
ncbi:MAG: hypothetical protein ACLTDR_06325 [Adlercreutzia equolifaciens]